MEIKLTRAGSGAWQSPWRDNNHISLCDGAFRRVIDVPRNVKTVYAVFTKRDVKPEGSLTLKEPHGGITVFTSSLGGVVETRAGLLWGTQRRLAVAHEQGYRFVHFEYA